jgi:hypothetical protein
MTIDCTGDGDIFHRAGAGSDSDIDERDIHHCINTAWLFGGVDMPRWIAFKTGDPDGFKSFMERGRAACAHKTPRWRKADSNCRSHPDKAVSEQRWQPLCNARRFCAGTGTETSKDE